jgi:hypothetical protein
MQTPLSSLLSPVKQTFLQSMRYPTMPVLVDFGLRIGRSGSNLKDPNYFLGSSWGYPAIADIRGDYIGLPR